MHEIWRRFVLALQLALPTICNPKVACQDASNPTVGISKLRRRETPKGLEARIAAIEADINANMMDQEVLRKMNEEYETERIRDEVSEGTDILEWIQQGCQARDPVTSDLAFIVG